MRSNEFYVFQLMTDQTSLNMPANRNMLSVEHLNKSFKIHHLGEKRIYGFQDVSFQLGEGKSLALFGPSGIGKSSVLKCIYRTYLSTSGKIRYYSRQYGEVDLTKLSEYDMLQLRANEIGYVTQFLKVIPRVKAVDVVAEPLVFKGAPKEEARKEARALLKRLNIPKTHLDAYPVTFSGGEQQRINIARAIIGKPRLLLLDEPTASLDSESINIVIDLLKELRAHGTSMVMIFHDQTILKALADSLYPMKNPEQSMIFVPKKNIDRPSNQDWIIRNARVIQRNGLKERTDILLQGGRIIKVGSNVHAYNVAPIDGDGFLVMPGFIDLHSDAVEKEIQPRPGGKIPVEIALVELDKRLAACGITTMYHCLAFVTSIKNELRTGPFSKNIADTIHQMQNQLRVHNRIHARFEILHTAYVTLLEELIQNQRIHLFSLMDHTPGQGQFTSLDDFKTYFSSIHRSSDEEINQIIHDRVLARQHFHDDHLRHLTALCREHGIPMASHDDDNPDKVRWAHSMGVQISEFPVTIEAAETAKSLDMHVLMGAPNILRGKSLTGNLSGREAIEAGYCDLIGSDHSPSNMLHAVFTLYRSGMGELHEMVNMVTYNPAKAIGMEERIGAIEPGLTADLVMVDDSGPVPRVIATFVDGKRVFSAY
ncbi:MAG: phosphonate metabolism protein PhnM [Deltaproteobacteria bacterium]|nr:phosphonate metabolism protein PhnM [Deltaproteobacteria bacterium]